MPNFLAEILLPQAPRRITTFEVAARFKRLARLAEWRAADMNGVYGEEIFWTSNAFIIYKISAP